jgi:hypothetical protein
MSEELTWLGGCRLPSKDDYEWMSDGRWERTDCAGWSKAVADAGGLDVLTVWSSLTDMDGEFGPPTIYTCWGASDNGNPVVAEASHPPFHARPCAADHAVFIRTIPPVATKGEREA